VMHIVTEDLIQPPRVAPGASMDDARVVADGSRSQWAVVVDGEDRLLGWIDLDRDSAGSVSDHLVPFEVQVPLGTTLRSALSEMLQHDLRWIPVVDENRYLGVLTPNRLHAAMRRSVGGTPVDSLETRADRQSAADHSG
jgi:osmoprotectant transport system ATP-binding protein